MRKQKLNNSEVIAARYHLSKWYGEILVDKVVGKDTIYYDNRTLFYYDSYTNGTTVWYDRKVENLYYLE